MIDDFFRFDFTVPLLNQNLIHFINVLEGTRTVLNDSLVIEIMVCGEKDIHLANLPIPCASSQTKTLNLFEFQ